MANGGRTERSGGLRARPSGTATARRAPAQGGKTRNMPNCGAEEQTRSGPSTPGTELHKGTFPDARAADRLIYREWWREGMRWRFCCGTTTTQCRTIRPQIRGIDVMGRSRVSISTAHIRHMYRGSNREQNREDTMLKPTIYIPSGQLRQAPLEEMSLTLLRGEAQCPLK
jgi:hypothetical protein